MATRNIRFGTKLKSFQYVVGPETFFVELPGTVTNMAFRRGLPVNVIVTPLVEFCSKCDNEAHPDTDPPLCLQCLQEKSECPPVGSGVNDNPNEEAKQQQAIGESEILEREKEE